MHCPGFTSQTFVCCCCVLQCHCPAESEASSRCCFPTPSTWHYGESYTSAMMQTARLTLMDLKKKTKKASKQTTTNHHNNLHKVPTELLINAVANGVGERNENSFVHSLFKQLNISNACLLNSHVLAGVKTEKNPQKTGWEGRWTFLPPTLKKSSVRNESNKLHFKFHLKVIDFTWIMEGVEGCCSNGIKIWTGRFQSFRLLISSCSCLFLLVVLVFLLLLFFLTGAEPLLEQHHISPVTFLLLAYWMCAVPT